MLTHEKPLSPDLSGVPRTFAEGVEALRTRLQALRESAQWLETYVPKDEKEKDDIYSIHFLDSKDYSALHRLVHRLGVQEGRCGKCLQELPTYPNPDDAPCCRACHRPLPECQRMGFQYDFQVPADLTPEEKAERQKRVNQEDEEDFF